MNKTQLKAAIKEQAPKAFHNGSTNERYPVHEYQAWLEDGRSVTFKIPNSEMKKKEYDEIEDAVDLIKWLV